MTDILQNLSHPSWWISVVLAGIAVNLLSAYIKPQLDQKIARFSLSRRKQLAAREQEKKETIAELASDRLSFIEAQQWMLFSTLMAILFLLLLSLIAIVFSRLPYSPFSYFLKLTSGLFATALFLRRGRQVVTIGNLLSAASEIRDKRKTSGEPSRKDSGS